MTSELTPPDRIAVEALILSLQSALTAKNADAVAVILDTKAVESAKILGVSADEARNQQKNFFIQRLFNVPTFSILPLNAADLTYTVLDNGKTVAVGHAERKHALQSNVFSGKGDLTDEDNKGLCLGLNPILSKLPDGQGGYTWKIVE